MFEDLITYETIHEWCPELFGFNNATFLRDFGPFKKGDKVENIWFDTTDSSVTEFIQNGMVSGRTCKFKLEALK